MADLHIRVPPRFGAEAAQFLHNMQAFSQQAEQLNHSMSALLVQMNRANVTLHSPVLNSIRSIRQHLDRFESVFQYATDALYYGLGFAARTALRSIIGAAAGPLG